MGRFHWRRRGNEAQISCARYLLWQNEVSLLTSAPTSVRACFVSALIYSALLVPSSHAASQLPFEAPASLPISSGELVLRGSDARRQILVTESIGSTESH